MQAAVPRCSFRGGIRAVLQLSQNILETINYLKAKVNNWRDSILIIKDHLIEANKWESNKLESIKKAT
jgi:hypothetical protein